MTSTPSILLSAVILLGATLDASAAAGADSATGCSYFEISAGRRPELEVANGTGAWAVEKRGRRISATRDGRAVPPETIHLEGSVIELRDPQENILLMLGLLEDPGPDGQLIYTPDLDPTSPPARLGFRAEPLDPELARHLGLGADEALLVDAICDRGSAVELREDDVIVAVDGRAPVSPAALARAVAARGAGERMLLRVRRQGEEREVAVEVAGVGPWPRPEDLARHIRSALGR